MGVTQAHKLVPDGPYPGQETSAILDIRRSGDAEIERAIATGLLLFRTERTAAAGEDPTLARGANPPPVNGLPLGYYTPTQAYKDLLSWPTSIVDGLLAGLEPPEPYRSALRPAHKLAIQMMRSINDTESRNQVTAMRELTDRVEGPVASKVEVSGTVSHVLVSPGRYPRPSFQPQAAPEAQVLDAQVVSDDEGND